MASSLATPSAGVESGGGFESEIGAALGAGWDEAANANGIDAGQEEPAADEVVEETPAESEAVSEPQADAAADPNAQVDPESPYQLTPDGKSYLVPKTALPQLQAAQKYQEAVSQFFGSPQEAQTSYYQASDHRAMGNDWMSGSPDAIQGVLNHFAGANHFQNPAVQQRYQQSFVKAMTEIVPSMVQKLNPQAYEGMVTGTLSKAIELAYNKAAQSNNPEDFKRAQELDWGVTGQYKTELPKVDPAAQRQTEDQRRMQDFEQRQTAAYQRDVQGFNKTAVEGAKFQQLDGLIEKTLAPVKSRYSDTAFADLKAGIQRDLMNKLMADQEWYREHGQTFNGIISDYKTTWQQGNPGAGLQPRVQSYIQNFLSRATRHLQSVAQPRIADATKRVVARTQQGQYAGKQPAARQVAAPAPAANGKASQGRMPSEQWDREFADMFKTA